VVRDHKKGTHSTLHLLASTFRNYTLSEPRFRALLNEGDAGGFPSRRVRPDQRGLA
jgi:hypothetical protein